MSRRLRSAWFGSPLTHWLIQKTRDSLDDDIHTSAIAMFAGGEEALMADPNGLSEYELERIERVGQLEPAPADVRMVAPAHLQFCILGDRLAGLGDLRLAREHHPRHDERLCPRAAFRQPALHQYLIDPHLLRHSATNIPTRGGVNPPGGFPGGGKPAHRPCDKSMDPEGARAH